MIKPRYTTNNGKFCFALKMIVFVMMIFLVQMQHVPYQPLHIKVTNHFDMNKFLASTPTKAQAKTPRITKTVYLTFDDGPTKLTGDVLDILLESNVKGTFFVLGQQVQRYPELINRVVKEEHVLGNHSYNHDYKELYTDFPLFWSQIKRTEELIHGITGIRPSLVRAPGGTAGHFDDTYFKLLKQGGYQVVDWNVDSGDSKRRGVKADEIFKGATSQVNSDQVIVLMHDGGGHEETIKALPRIISYYKERGYQFDVLSPELDPIQFNVTKSAKSLSRPEPSQMWTDTHVIPNQNKLSSDKRLVLEMDRVQTEFQKGEYLVSEGRIMVPLREMMSKLGVQVQWDGKRKTVSMNKGMESIKLDASTGQWISSHRISQQVERTMSVPVEIKGDTLWVPLRQLLEATGNSAISVSSDHEEWRVITTTNIRISYMGPNLNLWK